jgi:hypothetical protein
MEYVRAGQRLNNNIKRVINPYGIAATDHQRINRLERRVRLNTTELKAVPFLISAASAAGSTSIFDLTSINQGDTESTRTGLRMTLMGVKIRLHCDVTGMEGYLTLSPSGQTIASTDFMGPRGGFINVTSDNDFKELRHFHNYGSTNQYTTLNRKFKKGVKVHWSSSTPTSVTKNRLQMTVRNTTATAGTFQLCVISYYRDN